METIVLGGGCFWCTEASFLLIKGVEDVVPGYAGGTTENPTYREVASGRTGHAEVIKVVFDESQIAPGEVLDVFWAIHNPTTLNRQGNDIGSEYRSIILYTNDTQKPIIQASIDTVAKLWKDPIITEVEPLNHFYEAEPEHRRFFETHPELGYCQVVINPKLEKLRQQFASRIK